MVGGDGGVGWGWGVGMGGSDGRINVNPTLPFPSRVQMPVLLPTGLLTLERLFQALLQGWRGRRMQLRVGST